MAVINNGFPVPKNASELMARACTAEIAKSAKYKLNAMVATRRTTGALLGGNNKVGLDGAGRSTKREYPFLPKKKAKSCHSFLRKMSLMCLK